MSKKMSMFTSILLVGGILALVGFLTANLTNNAVLSLSLGIGIIVLIAILSIFFTKEKVMFLIHSLASIVIFILSLSFAYINLDSNYILALLLGCLLLYFIFLILGNRK